MWLQERQRGHQAQAVQVPHRPHPTVRPGTVGLAMEAAQNLVQEPKTKCFRAQCCDHTGSNPAIQQPLHYTVKPQNLSVRSQKPSKAVLHGYTEVERRRGKMNNWLANVKD